MLLPTQVQFLTSPRAKLDLLIFDVMQQANSAGIRTAPAPSP